MSTEISKDGAISASVGFIFRLARPEDNNLATIEDVLVIAKAYVEKSKDRSLKPLEIVRKLQTFTREDDEFENDPQFWIAVAGGNTVGYMLTKFVECNGREGLQIWQAFLPPRWTAQADSCMKTIEDFAREARLEFVSCITNHDPAVYERYMRRKGYERDYTAFIKELI